MSKSASSNAGGIGFPAILFLVFLVLKLTKVIDWSWWWITAPLWALLAIALLLIGGALIFEKIKRKYR